MLHQKKIKQFLQRRKLNSKIFTISRNQKKLQCPNIFAAELVYAVISADPRDLNNHQSMQQS